MLEKTSKLSNGNILFLKLAGLQFVIYAAVFCYMRITGEVINDFFLLPTYFAITPAMFYLGVIEKEPAAASGWRWKVTVALGVLCVCLDLGMNAAREGLPTPWSQINDSLVHALAVYVFLVAAWCLTRLGVRQE